MNYNIKMIYNNKYIILVFILKRHVIFYYKLKTTIDSIVVLHNLMEMMENIIQPMEVKGIVKFLK